MSLKRPRDADVDELDIGLGGHRRIENQEVEIGRVAEDGSYPSARMRKRSSGICSTSMLA